MFRYGETSTFEQEVAISDLDHGNLYETMTHMADSAFEDPATVQEWRLQGIPMNRAALPGLSKVWRDLEYHFVDVAVRTHPNQTEDDPECAISFHGHPLDYSLEVLLDPDHDFAFYPDYGRRHIPRTTQEAPSPVPKQKMFDHLFMLLGHAGVPESIQHPDRAEFDTRQALLSFMAQLSTRAVARSETILDKVQGEAIVGNEVSASQVLVDFSREREERPDPHTKLELVARTAVRIWDGVIAHKELSYSFRPFEPLDGDHTHARLKITTLPERRNIDKTDFERMAIASLRDAEESMARELIAASELLPYRTAKFDTDWD